MKLEPNGPLLSLTKPIHQTLTKRTAEMLRQAIAEGSYPSGAQIPSEKDLISRLGVSRTTLREALRILENDGLIERRRGLGTYVAEKPIVKDLSINFGISEMIRNAGMTPGVACIEVRTEVASSKIAARAEST